MKILASFFLAAALALPAYADDLPPDQLVQAVTNDVLAAIKSDKQLAAGDKQKALKLAEEKVIPHVDFEEATRLAVGRAWQQASPDQRQQLVSEFRSMLVRTYSNAIQAYEGQTLKVLPSRGKQADDDTTVRTQFMRAGGKPLPIDFQMHKTAQGWKIYDIVVEGVSLVLTYRSEFDAVVKQSGIDGLLKRLAQKNTPAAIGQGGAGPSVGSSTK
ncbi:MAG: ABC transporter substrate-binding protein [Betaproteobacteria bacterium]|nr:ABC transporter substrate-binding protein [Betaproteobacteria bacterium]